VKDEEQARLRAQLVLIPDAPLAVGADGLLRITIVQTLRNQGNQPGPFPNFGHVRPRIQSLFWIYRAISARS